MHRCYQPVRPAQNRLLQQKWDQEQYEEHRRRVGYYVPLMCTVAIHRNAVLIMSATTPNGIGLTAMLLFRLVRPLYLDDLAKSVGIKHSYHYKVWATTQGHYVWLLTSSQCLNSFASFLANYNAASFWSHLYWRQFIIQWCYLAMNQQLGFSLTKSSEATALIAHGRVQLASD